MTERSRGTTDSSITIQQTNIDIYNPTFNATDEEPNAIFTKFALIYAKICPPSVRRFFEYFLLAKALLSFYVLTNSQTLNDCCIELQFNSLRSEAILASFEKLSNNSEGCSNSRHNIQPSFQCWSKSPITLLNQCLQNEAVLVDGVKSVKNVVINCGSRMAKFKLYVIPAIHMLVFTFAASMLIRFSSCEVSVFIDFLQSLEDDVAILCPLVPLLPITILLVILEAFMSQFFTDDTTAFYVILVVWIADQYYINCCRTEITRRHWLKFFYLYIYGFYVFEYRFSGRNSRLSLLTLWFFIQHTMVYFFHRYELPAILLSGVM